MKKLIKYSLIVAIALLQVSCYKDKSVVDTNAISDVEIAFTDVTNSTIIADKNQTITVDPSISQTIAGKDLKYEWEINYQLVSTEKKLVYNCPKLGTFAARLKVSNSDGSSFKSFTLKVVSPYETGLVVLAQNESGDGTLGFLRKYSNAEVAAGKVAIFANNCYTLNNPGLKLGKYPTDAIKALNKLFITSSGEKRIIGINDKTFELETTATAPEYPNFKPIKMSIPDNGARDAVVLSEDGNMYKFTAHISVYNTDKNFPTNVSDITYGAIGYSMWNYLWDKSKIYNYLVGSSAAPLNTGNTFAARNMIQFFYANAQNVSEASLYTISSTPAAPNVYTKIVYDANLTAIKEITTLTGGISTNLKTTSKTLVNTAYKKLIYTNGTNIYSWFYSGIDSPTGAFINIDKGEITSMSQSTDGTVLYIGVYDAAATGLKGSIYVYNMDTGALITKHNNVTDKPIKLYFKE